MKGLIVKRLGSCTMSPDSRQKNIYLLLVVMLAATRQGLQPSGQNSRLSCRSRWMPCPPLKPKISTTYSVRTWCSVRSHTPAEHPHPVDAPTLPFMLGVVSPPSQSVSTVYGLRSTQSSVRYLSAVHPHSVESPLRVRRLHRVHELDETDSAHFPEG